MDFKIKYFNIDGKDYINDEKNAEILRAAAEVLYEKIKEVGIKLGGRKPTEEEAIKLRQLEIRYGIVDMLLEDWYEKEEIEEDIFL